MRTISVKVFEFSELSDKAKQRAKDDYAELFGYGHADEALESLKKLAEHFDGKLQRCEVDFFGATYSSAKFDMPEMTKAEIRKRLAMLGTYNRKTLQGTGECKLTGVCTDEDAIDGFRIAFIREKETDLTALMEAAFRGWLKACQSEVEYEYGDEAFAETCEANEYEFYKNGELLK